MANGEVRCIDSELPFEIPSSWEWCRIFQIGSSQLGKTLDRGKEQGDEYPYLCSINVYWDGVDLSKVKTFKLQDNELERYKVCKGDLLICEGGDYGRCAVWDREDEMYYQNALHRVRFFYNISPYFYKYVIELYRNIGYIVGQGQTIKHFTYENMKSLLFPLPPLNEQQNVVKKIDSVLSLTKNYTISQNALEKLNDEIFIRLKQSILQEAIQGHLVSQDPAEEPAEELLKRIHKEKERLVTEGKLKRKDVVESNIFKGEDNKYYEQIGNNCIEISDEIPFSIPEKWKWCRLKQVCSISMGQSPDGESVNGTTGVEFHQGKIQFGEIYLNDSDTYTNKPTKIAEANSLLLCVRAPVGILNITKRQICIGRGLCSINPYYNSNILLWFYFLSTYRDYFEKKATGSTFKAISNEIISNTLIPLPPMGEQQRIVERIQELYSKL